MENTKKNSIKININYLGFKNLLLTRNFLIIYSDFLIKNDFIKLHNFLSKNNLKITRINKIYIKFLFKENSLNNIFKSGISILYLNENNKEDILYYYKKFQNILELQLNTICLIGIWYKNKFFRPSEFKQYSFLNKKIYQKLFYILNFNKKIFFQKISLKKF